MKVFLPFFLFILCCIPEGYAGGFEYNFQGQKQAGMGNAGTGTLLDAGSVFFNPGAVSFLDTTFTINLGAHFQSSRTSYLESAPGTYQIEMQHEMDAPFSCYAAWKKKPSSRLSISFGIYSPFGYSTRWDDNWKGQFLVLHSYLTSLYFQPTLSYKLTDKLGIGAGFVVATGSYDLKKALPVQFSDGYYATESLHGSFNGFGYNAGLFYTMNEHFSLGLNYRSAVNASISSGTANFDVPLSLSSEYPNENFSTTIKMPYVATLGAGYKTGKFLFAMDLNYTGWSSTDSFRIKYVTHTSSLQDLSSPRMYKNSYAIRAGVQYKINDNTQARLGLYFDNSPIQPGYLSPEMPDADKVGFTCGLSYKVGKYVRLDGSFLYEEGMKRTDTNTETQFSGTYKTHVFVPGIGMSVVF